MCETRETSVAGPASRYTYFPTFPGRVGTSESRAAAGLALWLGMQGGGFGLSWPFVLRRMVVVAPVADHITAGTAPADCASDPSPSPATLASYAWKRHCRGLFETPIIA